MPAAGQKYSNMISDIVNETMVVKLASWILLCSWDQFVFLLMAFLRIEFGSLASAVMREGKTNTLLQPRAERSAREGKSNVE